MNDVPRVEYDPKLQPVFSPAQDLSASTSPLVQEALRDIQQFFGLVPEPFHYLTEESLPGIWQQVKALQYGATGALEPKYRDLINLGVSAQIPCRYSVYFSLKSAEANGATVQERTEAVLMAATVRQWSTVINGAQIPIEDFRNEVEQITRHVKERMASAPPLPREAFLVTFPDAAAAYRDIEETFGIVPRFFMAFPDQGIPGAWSEFKGIQLNPYTALPRKQKVLIGLAVAAQIPCTYCVTFLRNSADLYGASHDEIQEALALASMARHWSTIVNGLRLGEERLGHEFDQMLQYKKHGEPAHHS